MEKTIIFDCCALVLFCAILLTLILRKYTVGRLNQFFFVLIVMSIFSNLFDIMAILLDNAGEGNRVAKYVTHAIYLFMHNITSFMYMIYIVFLTDTWHKVKNSLFQFFCLWGPIFISMGLLISNPFTHCIFSLDDADTYTRGPLFFALYIIAAVYVVYGSIYLLVYRNTFAKLRLISLISVFPLMLLAAIYQFYNPLHPVEMYANSIGMFFVLTMTQRPEETIDIITGLGKFSAFASDIKRTMSNKKPVKIILIDIVNYEALRTMLSYDSKNKLIRYVSQKLLTICSSRSKNMDIYYLDNGQFRIVVEEKDYRKINYIAAEINGVLMDSIHLDGLLLNVTGNICVLDYPRDIQDFDALFTVSNHFAHMEYQTEVLSASEILSANNYDLLKNIDTIIENAYANRRFSVYYQPIYSVEERRFNSAEALLRLIDPDYGFVPPDMFIPAAEKSGAIHKIGALVMEEVCAFIASEDFKHLHIDYIEVNLSVTQCMQKGLADEISQIMHKYNVSPSQINLEITETAASYSQRIMLDNLKALDLKGIKFALDDYGTGYSNMRRIASLPLSLIKLDKTFTKTNDNPKLMIILENTISMIKAMNMKIVVEGVETEELLRTFINLGCEYIQGYYFSRPLPKEDFQRFIINSSRELSLV